ncbi:MAG: DinB family protein [Anaerolineae bacterium]
MPTKGDLAGSYERNLSVILRQTAGLSQADSLLQPAMRGNCLNWVLGHILSHRSILLEALGGQGIFTTAQHERYGYGSEPICGPGSGIIPLEELLDMLRLSQERLSQALMQVSDQVLAEERELGSGRMTCDQLILFLLWHESYHTGQTEYLRQLAGVNDKVI